MSTFQDFTVIPLLFHVIVVLVEWTSIS